jgi:hypothetical protein
MATVRVYKTQAEATEEAQSMRSTGWPTARAERSDPQWDAGDAPVWYVAVGNGAYVLDDGRVGEPERHITG